MNVLFWVGVGLGMLSVVVVTAASMLSSLISREEAKEPPAQCKRAKVLWVDGQPTMSYSIMRRPGHWLN